MGYYATGDVTPLQAAHTQTAVKPDGATSRRRRVNPLNIKALRRAERRVTSFVRIASRLVSFHKAKHLKHRKRRR